MPSTIAMTMLKTSATGRCPPEAVIMMSESRRPSPVRPSAPMMIPAVAQATETVRTLRGVSTRAS